MPESDVRSVTAAATVSLSRLAIFFLFSPSFRSYRDSGSSHVCRCSQYILHRPKTRTSPSPQILGGLTLHVCTNTGSSHVCCCTLEVLHRAVCQNPLPHRCFSRPGFWSQILVGLTGQVCTNTGSSHVCCCTLEIQSPQILVGLTVQVCTKH